MSLGWHIKKKTKNDDEKLAGGEKLIFVIFCLCAKNVDKPHIMAQHKSFRKDGKKKSEKHENYIR